MSEHPRLTNPPLTEVACGVVFDPLALTLNHISDFYQLLREEYPNLSLHPMIVEPGEQIQFGLGPGGLVMGGGLRAFMESADGVWLIQLQSNRIFVNWRGGGDSYPGMHGEGGILSRVLSAWSKLLSFAGDIAPRRADITKVNQLHQAKHWSDADDLVKILPFLGSLRASLHGPELHFNITLSDNTPAKYILSTKTLRHETQAGASLLVHLELSERQEIEAGVDLGSALASANEQMNARFFELIPAEQQHRFGGLIQ